MTALPRADEAELALLGACVIDQTVLASVCRVVSGADFLDGDRGDLFDAFWVLADAGRPLHDAHVLLSELRRLKIADSVRSAAFIAKLLVDGQVHTSHATFYAQTVKRASTLRRLTRIAEQLSARAGQPDADPAAIANWTEAQLTGIDQAQDDTPRPVADVASALLDDLRTPKPHGGTMTGLVAHDTVAGGWQPGELIVLAARPGIGKTSLAMQIAEHNAKRGRPVLFVSLEMADRELVRRWLAGLADVDSRRLRAGVDEDAVERIAVEADGVAGLPLRIFAPASATLARIRAVAKREAAGPGLALMIVDYIGLVQPQDPRRQRWEQVAEISRGLKQLAKELSIPVLALAQLNREAQGIEPRLSHLRDSGGIEQDADMVLFLHRDGDAQDQAQLLIAKHRHGQTGRVSLNWHGSRTRFSDNSFPTNF
jgi:replicative DNA helicase